MLPFYTNNVYNIFEIVCLEALFRSINGNNCTLYEIFLLIIIALILKGNIYPLPNRSTSFSHPSLTIIVLDSIVDTRISKLVWQFVCPSPPLASKYLLQSRFAFIVFTSSYNSFIEVLRNLTWSCSCVNNWKFRQLSCEVYINCYLAENAARE